MNQDKYDQDDKGKVYGVPAESLREFSGSFLDLVEPTAFGITAGDLRLFFGFVFAKFKMAVL